MNTLRYVCLGAVVWVAALAVSAAEMLEFGKVYMAQIVKNAQALAKALENRGIPILGAHRGYTQTHQVIANVKEFGGGLEVAGKLAEGASSWLDGVGPRSGRRGSFTGGRKGDPRWVRLPQSE